MLCPSCITEAMLWAKNAPRTDYITKSYYSTLALGAVGNNWTLFSDTRQNGSLALTNMVTPRRLQHGRKFEPLSWHAQCSVDLRKEIREFLLGSRAQFRVNDKPFGEALLWDLVMQPPCSVGALSRPIDSNYDFCVDVKSDMAVCGLARAVEPAALVTVFLTGLERVEEV